MATELETNAKTQKELESDLSSTKHQLLEIQHQMNWQKKNWKENLAKQEHTKI